MTMLTVVAAADDGYGNGPRVKDKEHHLARRGLHWKDAF